MKLFFLSGSIIFTVVILIIAFENFNTTITGFSVFFTYISSVQNPTLVFLGIALLGVFTGGFYFGFLNSLLKSDEEEEPGGTIK